MPNDDAAGPLDAQQVTVDPAAESDIAIELELSAGTVAPLDPLPDVTICRIACGEAAWITSKCPGKSGANEDAVAALSMGDHGALLLVADGLGGHRGGRRASQLMKTQLKKAVRRCQNSPRQDEFFISKVVPVPRAKIEPGRVDCRHFILDEVEKVNQRLLRGRIGSATTLALVELQGRRLRSYHVGDSEILVVSQRGRLKYSTVSHSPIGYAVESGLLTEEEALWHPDRHLVSNVVGSDQMTVELGRWMPLSARDTVLLASDGLFDNLLQSEIIETIRKGPLGDSVRHLAELARERMTGSGRGAPSKPDDLTILAYRGTRSKHSGGTKSTSSDKPQSRSATPA